MFTIFHSLKILKTFSRLYTLLIDYFRSNVVETDSKLNVQHVEQMKVSLEMSTKNLSRDLKNLGYCPHFTELEV